MQNGCDNVICVAEVEIFSFPFPLKRDYIFNAIKLIFESPKISASKFISNMFKF